MNPSHDKKRATKVLTDAVGFLALGAFALGATALGAVAIGAFSIRKLRLLEAKAGLLPVDSSDGGAAGSFTA